MVACLNGVQEAGGSNPLTQTKTEPIIDTTCHLSVQFLYARKALKTGTFQAIVGESALPEERQTDCFIPELPCSGLRAEKLSFQNGLSFHQKKAPVGSRPELRHRRFCYPALQHLGELRSIFEAEHQTPILVNRHPVDQVEPEPVAALDRQRVVKSTVNFFCKIALPLYFSFIKMLSMVLVCHLAFLGLPGINQCVEGWGHAWLSRQKPLPLRVLPRRAALPQVFLPLRVLPRWVASPAYRQIRPRRRPPCQAHIRGRSRRKHPQTTVFLPTSLSRRKPYPSVLRDQRVWQSPPRLKHSGPRTP